MLSFLQRIVDRVRPNELAAAELQLRVLVAMAAADDRISHLETDQILDFVDRSSSSARNRERLHALLDELLVAPPRLEQLLRDLSSWSDSARHRRELVHELADLAWSDEQIDHREEVLLDLVCDVFGFAPIALHGSSDEDVEDLHQFVRRLARTGRRAA